MAAGVEEVEHGGVLRGVAEIISDNRLQDVIDEVLHGADARDHFRRVEPADMDDLRDVNVERESIVRTHGDGRKFFVVMMDFGAVGRVEHDVGSRHALDFHNARVDRMFAGIKRRDPDTFVAGVDQIAVFEVHAADVHMRHPDVGHDHADVTDGDLHHRHLLDLDEPWVQVPRAAQENLLLQTAPPAAVEERLRVLEIVVAGDDRSGNFTGFDGPPVQRGDDADLVGINAMKLELFGKHSVHRRRGRSDDGEKRAVDAIRAVGDEAKLPALFAAVEQELARVLEVVALDDFPEDAPGRNRPIVRRDNGGNFALRHDDDRHLEDAILPAEESEVETRRQRRGLITGFAVEGDEPARFECAGGEFFHDNPHLPLVNQNRSKHERPEADDEHKDGGRRNQFRR